MRRQSELPIVIHVDLVASCVEAALDVVVLDDQPTIGSLGRDQTAAVHEKLVLLGLASHDGMVLQQQAGLLRPAPLVELIGCGESGEASTNDCQIDTFVNGLARGIGILAIAYAMRGVDHCFGVAVRHAVVAHAAVTGPGRSGGSE